MNKKLNLILIIILAVLVVLSVGKDVIAKISVEKAVEVVTGLRLNMGSLKIGIIKTSVGIKDLKLYNPKGYKDKIMVNMPEIYVDYDLGAIMKGVVHLNDMKIDLKEFVVVKNEKGELNLNALKVVQSKGKTVEPSDKKEGKAPEIQIDSLELKIGKVIYKDYSQGGEPKVQEFNIGLDERYTNINDPNKLVSLIVVKALMNTSIARLANFDLGPLKNVAGSTLATAQKVAGEAAAVAGSTLAATSEQTQKVVEGTSETLKKTTEGLEQVIKLPFGGGSKEEEK